MPVMSAFFIRASWRGPGGRWSPPLPYTAATPEQPDRTRPSLSRDAERSAWASRAPLRVAAKRRPRSYPTLPLRLRQHRQVADHAAVEGGVRRFISNRHRTELDLVTGHVFAQFGQTHADRLPPRDEQRTPLRGLQELRG